MYYVFYYVFRQACDACLKIWPLPASTGSRLINIKRSAYNKPQPFA